MVRSEIASELYKMEKYGVPRTHIECLIWFNENKGKIVDNNALRGKQVPGRTENGYPYSARKPIPSNNIVSEPHYLHSGIRGWYKPKGEKIVGYNKENRESIWEGSDDFVQALQTGSDGTLEGYGKEIQFDANGNWTEINYDHDPNRRYYEITGGYIQRCYENKIPIGIIYKKEAGQNEIMGLGLITKVSTNKLDYTIEPYKMNIQSQFQFVEKDFKCKNTKDDAEYRANRFVELFDALVPRLGSRFDPVKNEVGLSMKSRKPPRKLSYIGNYWKRAEKVYFDYTWLGVLLATPIPNPTKQKGDFMFPSRDTVQFQIGINPRDPIWAGIYIGRLPGNEKIRKRMLDVMKNEPEEFIRKLRILPKGYVIKIYGSVQKNNSTRLHGEWDVSNLDIMTLNEILETYSQGGTDFRICKMFSKKEALES
ncbi:hypothetical protein OAJ55_03120 [Candidatus Nitrosopelagicus sp.]|nr:hypothetical protein [Candidatus Nitrosopelagicus sp.]